MSRPFYVVTHRNWIADQLKPMGARQSFGLDINPETAPKTIWWAPGAWMARVHNTGIDIPLLSCGPDWLPNLPERYRGRRVQNKVLADIYPGKAAATFVKLPEAKHDASPARVYSKDCYLRRTLEQFNYPADTLWQLQEPVEFHIEARFWVAHGDITAESLYRIGDLIWGEEEFSEVSQMMVVFHHYKQIRNLAYEVAQNVPAAPGYTLDVGITTDDRVLVVEANAAWSSGPYDGDPSGIFETIEASHDFDNQYPQWRWNHPVIFNSVPPLKVVQEVA